MKAFSLVQTNVDELIQSFGGYFDEMTNLGVLAEEVGEVARLINRQYGQQSFKKGEKPSCVQSEIADELADVIFIAICLANQMNIDMDEAFHRNLIKKKTRDSKRHANNPALNAQQ